MTRHRASQAARTNAVSPQPVQLHWARLSPARLRLLSLAAILVVLLFPAARARSAETPSVNQFLIASDLHFNPMADLSLVADLTAAPPTGWEAILQRSKLTAFSQYGHDTNWWLFQSSLDQMRATLPHPAFIMITGDILAHQFPENFASAMHDKDREHYRLFVLNTVEFVALEFRKRFPDTKILITPGNDDEECGDYSVRANGIFLNDTADLARSLARADDGLSTEWKALGSYNIPHPSLRGIRILSLNTVFFSEHYHADSFRDGCAPVASTGPADLLQWLESNLAQAKAAHEKIWLMFHIPPGMDVFTTTKQYLSQLLRSGSPNASACAKAIVPMWVPSWTSQFDSLLERYQDTVIASFAGHTHADDFRLIHAAGTNELFVLIDPPISPIFGQNPAFRVVTFERDGSLADQSTYYLTNLEKASVTVSGTWEKEYTFSEQWKMRRLDAATLATLYKQIKKDPETRARWIKLYNVSSSNLPLPDDIARGLYCAAEALDPETYQSCYCPAPQASEMPPASPR
jgi:sphingomyelin phosphodiesterase acid-like 3